MSEVNVNTQPYTPANDYYYHGTDIEGFKAIVKAQKIGVDYFGEIGFYVTPDLDYAKTFGNVVIRISKENLDAFKCTTDDTNDGVLVNGEYPFDMYNAIIHGNLIIG